MTLKQLMEMLETIYNGHSEEITVQIGDPDGQARGINGIDFNESDNLLTIH